jgi:hypothetical protein
VTLSYATASVSGGRNVGGLAGRNVTAAASPMPTRAAR